MDINLKLTIFWIIIFTSFIGGGLFRKYFPGRDEAAKKLITFNLIFIEPPILLWTIWGLSLNSDAALLPIAGLLTVICGFIAGIMFCRILKLRGTSADSFKISSSLSNQGITMGGMICYLIAGEAGLGLASIYIIYYLPFVFIIIFPFARYSSMKYSSAVSESIVKLSDFITFFTNLRNLPLIGILAAFFLQIIDLPRPDIFFPLDFLLFTVVGVYYFTLGMSFKLSDLTEYKKEQASLTLIRFMIIPALTFAAVYPFNLTPEVKGVILIQSLMPAAVYSVISTVLYDLDSRLNSSLFAMNTLIFLIIVLPLMMLLKDILFSFQIV